VSDISKLAEYQWDNGPESKEPMSRDELFDHLNEMHCWEEWAFEGDGYRYMLAAHAAIHAEDATPLHDTQQEEGQ